MSDEMNDELNDLLIDIIDQMMDVINFMKKYDVPIPKKTKVFFCRLCDLMDFYAEERL